MAVPESDSATPVRRQYLEIKRRYPDAIVFFRLGDFYETFDDDARLCARELEITLTTRPIGKNQRVPLAGVPYHALDGYVAKLIGKGYKIAVCDQVGDAPGGRGVFERRVSRVLTPGTLVEENLLDGSRNNFLAAVVGRAPAFGLAHLDASTGAFAVTCLQEPELGPELQRIQPAEILSLGAEARVFEGVCDAVTQLPPSAGSEHRATELLLEHFRSATLEPYGCAGQPLAICAAAAALRYLADTQPAAVGLVTRLSTYELGQSMALDPQTLRNLEIFAGRGGSRQHSLIDVMDLTRTPMGGRLLRQRLSRPLIDPTAIHARLDEVGRFFHQGLARERLIAMLSRVPDLERLLTRVATGRSNPREVAGLGRGLELCAAIDQILLSLPEAPRLASVETAAELARCIGAALTDEPPASVDAGEVIRPGHSPELDALREQGAEARRFIATLEQRERERTGLRSLKVGYNRVFGYYIEISNAHRGPLPADYERRQTLSGAERFSTPELKEHESRALAAQEQISLLENSLFQSVCCQITSRAEAIRSLAESVAQVDVAASLAQLAALRGYVRPEVDGSDHLSIRQGRHPVVETVLPPGAFVPNDTDLSTQDAQIMVLTGPNMAGKSTYLRQTALIVLMAQCGSWVPAQSAQIGVVDRIFTRVGAQDDLAAGNSTFMVEMVEAAQILAHATSRSLIILDEVGRGTSTYDGLAIAQAIVEYLHDRDSVAARTIFATHYHELVGLARVLPRIRNFNVAVSEQAGSVVFLRTIVPGGADRSYGIHVAELAGLPAGVIGRARELLHDLELAHHDAAPSLGEPEPRQLPLLPPGDPLRADLAELDVDALTPLDAIRTLYELRERART
jgi:DNA mismatch repair protein MutS